MQKEDIRLQQVIIHIMDSSMGMPVLSDQVLDHGSDFGDFIRAHIYRLMESDDMKKCIFDEDSRRLYFWKIIRPSSSFRQARSWENCFIQ